jgi:hypothetical protein
MKLLVTDSTHHSREWQVTTSASMGRWADNTIQLEDAGVGWRHALLERRWDGDWVRDLGSTNGTFVNGARIGGEYRLQTGDVISLGGRVTIQVLEALPLTSSAISSSAPMFYPLAPVGGKRNPRISLPYWVVAGLGVLLVLLMSGVAIRQFLKPKRPSFAHEAALAQGTLLRPTAPSAKTGETPNPSLTSSPVPIDKIPVLVRNLASQLTGKPLTYYQFDPLMLAEIRKLAEDYRLNVTIQAQEAKPDIVRAFSDARGLKPLFGFVLAMSESRFQASQSVTAVGYWRVPMPIAQMYAPGESWTSLNQLEPSANLAAEHLRDVRSVFPDDADFMYLIACFGMPRHQAGDLHSALQLVSDDERRDFWKMVTARKVSPEGAARVVRFFAAGIVGENPSVFRLPAAKAFSEL